LQFAHGHLIFWVCSLGLIANFLLPIAHCLLVGLEFGFEVLLLIFSISAKKAAHLQPKLAS